MGMLKSIVIFIVFFFIKSAISVESLESKNEDIIVTMGDRRAVVTREDDLINVTIQNDNYSCMINDSKTMAQGLQALAYNQNKIIVWYTDRKHEILGLYRLLWYIYFIDPKKCTYESYHMDNMEMITNYSYGYEVQGFLPWHTVMSTQDMFDRLEPKLRRCFGCREIGKGKKVLLFYPDHEELDQPMSKFVRVSLEDPIGGYLETIKVDNCTTLLIRLNPKHQVIGERRVNGSVKVYSTKLGKINICYLPGCAVGRQPITCEFLNSVTLRSISTIPLNHDRLINFDTIQAFMRNLPGDKALVTTIYEQKCENGTRPVVYFGQRIDLNGQVSEPAKVIKELQCGVHDFMNIEPSYAKHCLFDMIFMPERSTSWYFDTSCPGKRCLEMYCTDNLS